MNVNITDLVKMAWDCDTYDDRPLPVGRMLELLETVRWTASAANVQPWECILVQEPQRRRQLESCLLDPFLRPAAPSGRLERAPVILVVAVDRKRASARHGEIGERLLAVQDTAVAIAHLRLAAAEQGIGSAWIREVELARAAEVLELPRGWAAVALLSFGFSRRLPSAAQGMAVSDWTLVLGA
jgi:nitroreductase